jgi:hypothetical protein
MRTSSSSERPAGGGSPACKALSAVKLARWLRDVPGREADAERAYRDAAHAVRDRDRDFRLLELAKWLNDLSGREADAEQAYRQAAATGSPRCVEGPRDLTR